MHSLPSAAALSRVLLAVERARTTGVLVVSGRGLLARIGVSRGAFSALRIAPGDENTVGRLLCGEGALEHAPSRSDVGSDIPYGAWLVAEGLASSQAVSYALRLQMRRRMRRVLCADEPQYRFVRRPLDAQEPGAHSLVEPLSASELVIAGMRELVSQTPKQDAERRLEADLVVTRLGERLFETASLWPDESAVVAALRRGRCIHAALDVAGRSARAVRFAYALRLLNGLAPAGPGGRSYTLLLRKCHELRRSIAPHALLDVPRGSTRSEVRRAFRKLAGTLHPDRFGLAAPPALRRVSTEVVAGLARAEASLR